MQVERFHWKTEEAFDRIKTGKPVVLRECPIVFPHHVNWTLGHLAEIIKDDFPCTIYLSPNKRFPYFDTSKNSYNYKFTPQFRKDTMTFREFQQRTLLQNSLPPEAIKEFWYLNQSLVAEMGPKILEEYSKFSLQTAALYRILAGWSEMMHNLLMCGNEGYTTPLHYDEVENIFTQLQGRKRVRLFPADCWPGLYPYPVGHPRDRQCQITLPKEPGCPFLDDEYDRYRFPHFPIAAQHELVVDLEPGEMLYIPQYWFHQMEALTNENVSLSWWFKHTSRKDIDYKNIDLNKITFSAVRRNIEGVMAQMMGGGRKAHELFLSIASGRIKIPGIQYKTAPSSSSSSSSSSFITTATTIPSTSSSISSSSTSSAMTVSEAMSVCHDTATNNVDEDDDSGAVGDDDSPTEETLAAMTASTAAAAASTISDSTVDNSHQHLTKPIASNQGEEVEGEGASQSTLTASAASSLISEKTRKLKHYPPRKSQHHRLTNPTSPHRLMMMSSSSSSSSSISSTISENTSDRGFGRRIHYVTDDLIVHDTDAGALYLKSSDDEKWKHAVEQALSMLRTLFPPDVAAGFLLQVAVGRFSALELQQE
jgi:hypoxia-inducible factor 1-alpha inhibitor (HIF hydroxylase)